MPIYRIEETCRATVKTVYVVEARTRTEALKRLAAGGVEAESEEVFGREAGEIEVSIERPGPKGRG